MVSKRWQRTHFLIQHLLLVLVGVSWFLLLQLDLPSNQKIGLVAISLLLIIVSGRYLHRRYANSMVKVFELEYSESVWLIQRELKASYIPFVKNAKEEMVTLKIQGKNIVVTIEEFPINLMIDDHLTSNPGTKITMSPINHDPSFIESLCSIVDKAFLTPLPKTN